MRGPARGFPHSLPVDELDLAPFLIAGVNLLAVHVLSFGISTAQNVFRDRAGFYLEGLAVCQNGLNVELDSNQTWRFQEAPGYRRHVSRSASQMGYQEHFDSGREAQVLGSGDWTLPDYNDSNWQKPHLLGAVGVLPWRTLEERGISLLEVRQCLPLSIGGQCEAQDLLRDATPEESCNVTDLVAAEKREPGKNWFQNPETLTQDTRPVPANTKLKPLPQGRCATLLVDFGETRFGFPNLKLSGASGGEVFDLVYDEQAGETGIDAQTSRPVRAHLEQRGANETSLGDRLICGSGNNSFESLQPRGLRYLMLVARNIRKELTIDELGIQELAYPTPQRGRFSCSDPGLNAIWDTGVRTLRRCMADTFMDSPSRSQEQGWASARVAGMTCFYALGDSALYRRGLRLMAQSMLPDGLLLGVVPSERPDCVLLDYCLHWVLSLHEFYQFTGDVSALKEHRGTLERVLSFFAVHAGERGLLGPASNYSLFLDWAPGLDRGNLSATFNIMYLQALRRAADIGRVLDDSGFANHCSHQASVLADRILLVFASSNSSLLVESVNLRSGEPGDLVSQHATALAVSEGILGRRDMDRSGPVSDVLSAFLEPPGTEATHGPIRANLFFRTYVHEALCALGLTAVALEDIRRTWGYMLSQGAATWWERMPMRPGASYCHAWSTHPTSFLPRHILGLYPTAPGWKRFGVRPKCAGLTHASGKVPTPKGEIELKWEIDAKTKRRQLELTVPAGTEALVGNPGKTAIVMKEGLHRWEDEHLG